MRGISDRTDRIITVAGCILCIIALAFLSFCIGKKIWKRQAHVAVVTIAGAGANAVQTAEGATQ